MIGKQTTKHIFLGLIIAVNVLIGLSFTPYANAAECGGVKTSIISCEKTGVCVGGERPFENTQPEGAADSKKYEDLYGHPYGKCVGGVDPVINALENTGVWAVLLLAINILSAGIGIAAIGGIVYGSILYTSAGGSQEQVKKALGIITNVVIGIIAYALMFSFLNFLIPGGLFN